MCGYMFIFTDPMELAGAEMIAADQAVLVVMPFDFKVFQSGL